MNNRVLPKLVRGLHSDAWVGCRLLRAFAVRPNTSRLPALYLTPDLRLRALPGKGFTASSLLVFARGPRMSAGLDSSSSPDVSVWSLFKVEGMDTHEDTIHGLSEQV